MEAQITAINLATWTLAVLENNPENMHEGAHPHANASSQRQPWMLPPKGGQDCLLQSGHQDSAIAHSPYLGQQAAPILDAFSSHRL